MKQLALLLAAVGIGAVLGYVTRPSLKTSASGEAPTATGAVVLPERRYPVDAVLGALTQRGTFRQFAQIGELLDDLDDGQMSALMTRIERLPTEQRDLLLPRLMGAWTKRNRQAATEWIRPILERFSRNPFFGMTMSYGDTDLIRVWASNAPDLAFEFARQYADKGVGRSILHNAMQGRRGKHAETLSLMLAFPTGKAREEVMPSLFFSWVQSDRKAALAAATALPPGVERDGALESVLAWTSKSDPATALAKYGELELGNPRLLRVLVYGAAKKDPAFAAKTLEHLGVDEVARLGSVLAAGWAEKDPAAAFEWAQQNGIAIDRNPDPKAFAGGSSRLAMFDAEYSYDSPLRTAARKQPEAVIAFLRSLPAGPERDRYIQQTVWSAGDKPAVQSFMSELPMTPYIMQAQLSRIGSDVPKAEEYVKQLPQGSLRELGWRQLGSRLTEPLPVEAGPERDAMLLGMAQRNLNNAEALWSRLSEIGDAGRRKQAFDDLACKIAFPPPGFEYQSLSELLSLPAVPEEYKAPWRGF